MAKKLLGISIIFLTYAITTHAQDVNKADEQWRGFINAGGSLASGNTKSRSAHLSTEATKLSLDDKMHGYITGLYGTQRDSNGEDKQTANLIRSGGRYDYNISPKNFTFGSLDFERDKLQRLNLRSVVAGGVGKHLISTPEKSFNIMTGLTYSRESFVDDTRYSTELLFAEESNHKISDTASFRQRFALMLNLTDTGEYRAQFDAGLNLAVTKKIGLQLTASDRYQSNPLPGIKKNDALFLASVSYKFGPQ